jgi:plastocyanin
MGIMHAYVAPATAPVPACAPLPGDVQTLNWTHPYRIEVPRVDIPLAARGPDGTAHAVSTLEGAWYSPRGDAVVRLRDLHFSHRKVVLARGASILYEFDDPFPHDVTSASGPTAFGSQPLEDGARWRLRFTKPGTYAIYCTLHPLDMQQLVAVR